MSSRVALHTKKYEEANMVLHAPSYKVPQKGSKNGVLKCPAAMMHF